MYLQKWNQQLIILFIHADFSPWLISLVVGVINFISNTDYSGTFRQALVELLISNHIVSLIPSLSISYRVKCLLNVKGDCLPYYLKINVIYNVGNRGGKRQKSYIFCLLWFIITFSSRTAFARGGWLELQSSSPSCISSGGSSVASVPKLASAQDTPCVSGKSPTQHSTRDSRQDFHPEVQRWRWITQAAGKVVALAAQMSWHFAGASVVLFSGNTC